MSKTHTPGPWYCTTQADETTGSVSTTPVGYGSYGNVAQTWGDDAHGNARLISAAPDLLRELEAAHQIIRNALNLMTTEQKAEWGRLNERDGVDGEGVTRANEREAVIDMAVRGNWPR